MEKLQLPTSSEWVLLSTFISPQRPFATKVNQYFECASLSFCLLASSCTHFHPNLRQIRRKLFLLKYKPPPKIYVYILLKYLAVFYFLKGINTKKKVTLYKDEK